MFGPENGVATPPAVAVIPAPLRQRSSLVPAVAKAFRLLEIVGSSQVPLGTSELARRLQLGKSTVHALVKTLESIGVLERVPDARRYRLAARWQLAPSGVADD